MKIVLTIISFITLMLIGWWYIKVNVKGFGFLLVSPEHSALYSFT